MRRLATAAQLEEVVPYHGPELRPHFLRERFGLHGDAAAVFIGPCRVATEDLVDLEDRERADHIAAKEMLHLLVECFEVGLSQIVLLQRLLVARTGDLLRERLDPEGAADLRRRGDDLHLGPRKLSVSIATVSPVSGLVHLGLNVDPEGAPVPAVGLNELGVSAPEFALELLAGVRDETEGVLLARAKVRPVSGDRPS